ncbi:MAG: hypothetical protein AAFY76_13980, partial [Cyanobacteria bacterium J06649_11]
EDILITQINDKITDINGITIKGVKVLCTNCIDESSTVTDSTGLFTLKMKYKKSSNPLQVVEICFIHLEKRKCISQNVRELHSIPLPRF